MRGIWFFKKNEIKIFNLKSMFVFAWKKKEDSKLQYESEKGRLKREIERLQRDNEELTRKVANIDADLNDCRALLEKSRLESELNNRKAMERERALAQESEDRVSSMEVRSRRTLVRLSIIVSHA